jgi:DNA-binding winged helix-turn-helix (wHTH) protein
VKRQNYQICEATYDPLRRQFHFNDGDIETLSPLEGKVFVFLLQNVGDCVERSALFKECWGDVIVSEQALTNVVSKLRKTLAKVTCDCAVIRTVSKTGYSLEISSSTPIQPQRMSDSDVGFESEREPETSSAKDVLQVAGEPLEKTSSNTKTLSIQNGRATNIGFYVIAVLCISVIAFNLYRAFDSSLPYFVDQSQYSSSYVDKSNQHYLHVVREERYSIDELELALTTMLPKHCYLRVFVRIYPSVDEPENDALSMFVQKENGQSFNYIVSVFDPKTSFDSFKKYVATRDYLCGL